MKKFTVEVFRKVVQVERLEIETTSSYKARAIAEYQANDMDRDLNWEVVEPKEPVRITSTVIGVSSKGE